MCKGWAPHYADIYLAKFENEVLLNCPLKTPTSYQYLDDVFIIWSYAKQAFSQFLNIFNTHEPPIKFISSICIYSVN